MAGVLEVKHVYKTFVAGKTRIEAVRNMSLTIEEGEAVGLVGESGCGKSTLAKLITRLETCDSGQILLCGEDLTRLSGSALRRAYRNLKMIFQQPRSSFDPRLSIGASIGETLKVAGMARKERYGEIERLLRMVGLDASYAKAKPMELSGGECQRAAIARAIAAKPRLLICDECTSALDVSVQAQIMDLLRQLRRHQDMSFLFISHDLALVSSFCDRVYVMKDGTIVEDGNTLQVINDPQHNYTKSLLASVLPA